MAATRSLAILCGIAALALLSPPAAGGEPLSALLRDRFGTFCRAADGTQQAPSTLERAPGWVRAANDDWIFLADVVGSQGLHRPGQAVYAAASQAVAWTGQKIWMPPAIRQELIDRTRHLAGDLVGVPADQQGVAHLKQEVVVLHRRGTPGIGRLLGRYLVRLWPLPGRRYFQVMYTRDRKVLRIDTNAAEAACLRLAAAIDDPAPDPAMAAFRERREPLAFGSFFDPEGRFELNAYSHEGRDFLDCSQRRDPFGRSADPLTAYRHWCWIWWNGYGRVGAIRGNWQPEAKQWEHPGVRVLVHRSLADYPLKNGEPRQTRTGKTPEGKEFRYPFAGHAEFTPRFYEDVEQCHVVYISTHGGGTGRRFRFRRNFDVWVKLEPPAGRPLGCGNLRHLFFEGCNGMSYVADGGRNLLEDTWLRSGFIDGLRTVSGHDGGHTGLDRSGWRFYGWYNKGASISDAWLLGQLDENVLNNPVTVAYGQDRQEALRTLLLGRFTTRRAEAEWAAASLWENVPDGK